MKNPKGGEKPSKWQRSRELLQKQPTSQPFCLFPIILLASQRNRIQTAKNQGKIQSFRLFQTPNQNITTMFTLHNVRQTRGPRQTSDHPTRCRGLP